MGKSGFNLFVLLILLFCGSGDVRGEESHRWGDKIFASIRLKLEVWRGIVFPSDSLRLENRQEESFTIPFNDDDFVKIPSKGANFMMGFHKYELFSFPEDGVGDDNEEEEDVHPPVEVRFTYAFEMMKKEFTQAQWFALTGKNPSHFKERKHCPDDYKVESTDNGDVKLCPSHPVESVSWFDIQSVLARLSNKQGPAGCGGKLPREAIGCYRLPTEAEWEFAARGGTTTLYSFGDEGGRDLAKYGWYWENSGEQTHPVGLKLENPYGLFDMHGNVWEWTLDRYERKLPGGVNPYSRFGIGYIIRGGGWHELPWDSHSAVRSYDPPAFENNDVGFRLVRTL